MWRDLERDCGEKCFEKIKKHFKVNPVGMRGGETVEEVVALHRALSEAGGSCTLNAGGASADAAAHPDFDKRVSVHVHFLNFSFL